MYGIGLNSARVNGTNSRRVNGCQNPRIDGAATWKRETTVSVLIRKVVLEELRKARKKGEI